MPIYIENKLKVSLNDFSFRFQDISIYKHKLNGQCLCEMDFGWWDASKQIFWLLELKDYSSLSKIEKLPEHLLENLISKATDSLLMLSSAWIGSLLGQQIRNELPIACQSFPILPQKIKLVFVLNLVHSHQKVELGPLKDRLANKLRGRISLFDMSHVTLTDYETAVKMGLPIETIDS